MSYGEKKLKVWVVYFLIFKIRKYVIYYLRLPCDAKYNNNYINIQVIVLKNVY